MLFLGIKSVSINDMKKKCRFLTKKKAVFDSKYDTTPYYVNVIEYEKDIINADYSVLLSAYVLCQDCKGHFYQKRSSDRESGVYYIAHITVENFEYIMGYKVRCYTYYIKNIKNLLKKNDNKNTFLNLLLEQYKYENTEKWVDFVRVSLTIEKLSYVASIFTLRKYGYIPNKDNYCNLFLLVEEILKYKPIDKLITNILQEAFINKTYDNTTLFFLLRSLRNFMFIEIMDSDITNLQFNTREHKDIPFSTSEKIFDFGELKMYIQKSVNLNIHSLQRGYFEEYNFIRVIKEKLVYNYDQNDVKKFAEATALLIAASMTRLSKLKLVESIFINVKDTVYGHYIPGPSEFRVQYTLESLEKEKLPHSLESDRRINFSHSLGYFHADYFSFFSYSKKETKIQSKKLCKEHISYVRIDVYESKIRYNDKTLYLMIPIISYKCNPIPSHTGKIYDIKEIEDKIEEGFLIFTRNIHDKENNKLDISIIVNKNDESIRFTVFYNLLLFMKEEKPFYLDEFLAI